MGLVLLPQRGLFLITRATRSLLQGSPIAFMVLGAAVIALLHVFFALTQESIDWGDEPGILFTFSRRKAKLASEILFLATFLALSSIRQPHSVRVQAGLAIFGGTLIAMVVVLFILGPGNLWPIVIVLGGIRLAPAFILGVLLSLLVTEVQVRWTSRRS